jgi:NTP pyrophosphatase (non-canonical NTP hydrolase)
MHKKNKTIKKKVFKISEAQTFVKNFAKNNKWSDEPNIDKFDHLHEELIEMSKLLRYKSSSEMKSCIKQNKDTFEDGIGDLFFGFCRLANQLGIDITKSFNLVSDRILTKYKDKKDEAKHKL